MSRFLVRGGHELLFRGRMEFLPLLLTSDFCAVLVLWPLGDDVDMSRMKGWMTKRHGCVMEYIYISYISYIYISYISYRTRSLKDVTPNKEVVLFDHDHVFSCAPNGGIARQ